MPSPGGQASGRADTSAKPGSVGWRGCGIPSTSPRATTRLPGGRPGGLCESLLEEVQADSGPKRRQEGLQRPSVIREENPPCLQVGDGSLDGRTKRADLVIIVMLAHGQVTVFRLAHRSDDVISSNKSLVADHVASQLQDHLTLRSF